MPRTPRPAVLVAVLVVAIAATLGGTVVVGLDQSNANPDRVDGVAGASTVASSSTSSGTASGSQGGTTTLVTDCRVIDDPGHYTLDDDITVTGNCIDIQSGGVTFDGNGHVIQSTGGGWGIDAGSGSNIVVKDVTLRHFTVGVEFYGVDNGEISGVTIEPEHSDGYGVSGTGIALLGDSQYNVVENNAIDRAGSSNAPGQGRAIRLNDAHNNEITNNDITAPTNYGIFAENARDNTITSNQIWGGSSDRRMGTGIHLDTGANGTALEGNYVYGGTSPNAIVTYDGIVIRSDDNTLVGNDVDSVYYSGIYVAGEDNELDSNHVSFSGEHGIEVRSSSIDVTNNIVTGNGMSGLYFDDASSGTIQNNTASGNSNWDVRLVSSIGLDVENTALSSGAPGVSTGGGTHSIRGVGSEPTPTDMDDVGQFFEVDGSPTVEVHYTDAAAIGVDEANLSLWRYDGGSSWTNVGGSVDTAANVVTGNPASGVYAPLAIDTQTPTISNLDATSPGHEELRISFDASEPLDAVEVVIENESGTVRTLTQADFSGSGTAPVTYTNDSTVLPGSYDVTLLRAEDGAGNDGASGQTDDAFVTAGLGITARAIDEGDDGHVIDGERVELNATVTGYGIQSVTADADTLGVGTVDLEDPDGDGIYVRNVTVDADNGTNGVHSIQFTANDGSGQTDTDSVSLDLDERAPSVNVVDGNYSVVGPDDEVEIAVEITDRNGVASAHLNASHFGVPVVALTDDDDDDVYNGTFTVDAANSSGDGIHSLTIVAVDTPGNVRDGSVGSRYLDTGDDEPPDPSNAIATNLDGTNDDVGDGDEIELSVDVSDNLAVDDVVANASDFGGGDVVLLDPDGDGTYAGRFTVDTATALPDGAYGIEVVATDLGNNEATATTNALTLDTPRDLTPPKLTSLIVSDPFDDGFVTDGDVVDVAVTVTDARSGVASVEADASAFGAGTVTLEDADGDDVYEGSFTVDAGNADPDGYVSLVVEATDVDGNADSVGSSLQLDRSIASDATPPTVADFDASPRDGDRIFVTLDVDEVLTAVELTVRNDSGAVVGTTGASDRESLSQGYRYYAHYDVTENGTYEVSLDSALDLAGNDGAAGETVNVTVGGTDDGSSGDEPPDGGTGPAVITVDGRVNHPDGSPAVGDAVVLVDATDFGDGEGSLVDANGSFSITAPRGPTYFLLYAQENGTAIPADGTPDVSLLGTVTDNETIETTLPDAYEVSFEVVRGDTGTGVANATLSIAPGDPALPGLFTGETGADGRIQATGSTRNTLEIAGTIFLNATPPAGSDLEATATNLSISAATNATVVLPVAATGGSGTDGSGSGGSGSPGGSGGPGGSGSPGAGNSGAGGGSGGAPGGAPAGPPSVVVDGTGGSTTATVTNAVADQPAYVAVPFSASENASVTGMDVTTNADGDYTLEIENHEERPTSANFTTAAGLTELGYLSIDHTVPDSEIDSVVFTFRVRHDRLADVGLAPDDVVLYRNVGDQLVALPTTQVDDTGGAYVFEAESPGLSVFVVGSTVDDPDDGGELSDDGDASDGGSDGSGDETTDGATGDESSGDDDATDADDGATDADDADEFGEDRSVRGGYGNGQPGFGVPVALAAVLATLAMLGRGGSRIRGRLP